LQTAVDIVRLPCRDFDARAAHVVASLPATVLREGRLLYDAGRVGRCDTVSVSRRSVRARCCGGDASLINGNQPIRRDTQTSRRNPESAC
jgi:hypothetical protein